VGKSSVRKGLARPRKKRRKGKSHSLETHRKKRVREEVLPVA